VRLPKSDVRPKILRRYGWNAQFSPVGIIYSNENFPLPIVDELRKFGHDVLTIQETGKAGQAMSDEEVLAFANKEKRILLTINRF
jgi:hypothetical protein